MWTDYWLSIVCAGCGSVCVGAGEEQARKVLALQGLQERGTSRLGSRDPVADGIECGQHGARRARRSREQGAGAFVAAKSRNKARSSMLSWRRDLEAKDLWLEAWRRGRAGAREVWWFGHKIIGGGFLGLGLKIEYESPTRRRRDPGASGSFEAEATWRDR